MGTFSKIDHILGHKASLNKFKKIEISPWIISDHNGKNYILKKERKKSQKIFKHMDTKEHTAEKPISDRSNKGRNQKIPTTQ
jgi:hypothetical protein